MQKELPTEAAIELTEREREILKLLATGSSNKEIARDLVISSNTVKVHLRNIFAKIGAASRTEAAMYAVKSGMIKSPGLSEGGEAVPAALTTVPIEAPARPRTIFRLASVVAILLVLVVAAAMGILLSRQQAASATNSLSPNSTTEARWKILPSLPTARNGLAVTSFEDQIYAIGGENKQGVTGAGERFDPATDTWVELAPKPTPVTDVKAAVIGGMIFIPGGLQSNGTVTNVLEIYNPRQNLWEKGKSLPIGLSAYAMTAFEGLLYLFGGWDGKKYLDTVLIYNPIQDEWELANTMPEARAFAGAAVAGDKIYLIGGYNGKQALKLNEIYSPFQNASENSWSQAEPLREGRYAFGLASIADSIYILGGKTDITTSTDPLLYIAGSNQWHEYESPPLNIGQTAEITFSGQLLYALGGTNTNGTGGSFMVFQAIYSILLPILP